MSEFIDRAVGDTGSIVNVSVVGTDICVVVCVIVVVAIPVVVVLSVVGVDGSVVIGDVDLVGTVVVGGIGCMCSKKLAINVQPAMINITKIMAIVSNLLCSLDSFGTGARSWLCLFSNKFSKSLIGTFPVF